MFVNSLERGSKKRQLKQELGALQLSLDSAAD